MQKFIELKTTKYFLILFFSFALFSFKQNDEFLKLILLNERKEFIKEIPHGRVLSHYYDKTRSSYIVVNDFNGEEVYFIFKKLGENKFILHGEDDGSIYELIDNGNNKSFVSRLKDNIIYIWEISSKEL